MGVESLPSTFPFGNLGPNIRQKLSLGQLAGEIYKKGTGPLIGVFYCFRPTIVLRDPDLIRNICGADFKYFYHRGFHVDEKNDTTAANMFFSNGEPWKRMREKLSPAFTSGKLKGMFNTILACGKTVQDYMDPFADRAESLEVREVFARYSTNIIASVAFGLEVDCVTNPDNEFRRNGMAFFEVNLRNALRQFLRIVSPTLSRLLRVRITDHKVQEFMTSMVKQNLDYREQNNIVRKDFFQLLMDLHRTGAVQLDDEWKTVIGSKTSQPLTIDEITAHALIFFVAAFETSSSTMSFCLLELAKNPEIQRKVQAEIDAAGEISYDTIDEMKYLDCCVNGMKWSCRPLLSIANAFTFYRNSTKTSATDGLLQGMYGRLQSAEHGYHHRKGHFCCFTSHGTASRSEILS